MIPFYRPFYSRSELLAALRPGQGREDFEAAVARRVGARHGVAFAYGRAGILGIFRALGITGSEVMMPAYICQVVAQPVVISGNRPVFVDINLDDYNMDLDAVKHALTPQTRAIIAPHMFGYPLDIEAIREMTAGDNDILIIEDRAQGILSGLDGRTGLQGDIGLYSFGTNKQLSTVQGGVVVTGNCALYEKIRAYRDREMNTRSFRVSAKRWLRLLANYVVFRAPVYKFLQRFGLIGYQSKLNRDLDTVTMSLPDDYAVAYVDFLGRVGLAQLDKLDTVLSERRAIAELYTRELASVPGLDAAPIVSGATYAYYTIRVDRRDEMRFPLRIKEYGVAVDQVYDYVLPRVEPYQLYAQQDYPHANQAARQVVNLPIYPDLDTASVQHIAESVKRVLQEPSS